MKKSMIKLRNEFMDVVGSISVDELAQNQRLTQTIREIYQELSNGMETEEV